MSPVSRNWLAFPPNRLPIVYTHIGVWRIPTLIDTGAEASMISPDVAARLGRIVLGHDRIRSITGYEEIVPISTVENWGWGGVTIPTLKVLIVNLERFGRNIDAILGVNAFSPHKLQFDFSAGRLYLLD